MNFKLLCLFIIIPLAFSCSGDLNTTASSENNNATKPNILLIIADDMGLDATPVYNIGIEKPTMPNLESMTSNGIRFNNLWSYPTCTPTRSSIITGKYGFRTNVMKVDDELSMSETSLQKYLDNSSSGYNHAIIGKWHLSKEANHPTNMGVGYYAGLLTGGVNSYTNWNFTENGQTSTSSEYTTTKFTDLAINWVDNQTEPWFLWLAYNAPHTPFHLPPNDLHTKGLLPTDEASINANPLPYYMAMLEAMDTEIGRLLNSMSEIEKENTVIIFIGDNGTPGQVVQEYSSQRSKGTVYQGGVNVPMIISGKGITRINETEEALINTTDIFATVTDLAETGTSQIHDSKSFKELFTISNTNFRDFVYTEIGNDSGGSDCTIRNATHKYILFDNGDEALYDLTNTFIESSNLLNYSQLPLNNASSQAKDLLTSELNTLKNN